MSEVTTNIERMEELNKRLAGLNGLAIGLPGVSEVIGLFRLSAQLANYPAAVLRAGIILAVNEKFESLLGWSEDDLVGRHAEELAVGPEQAVVRHAVLERDPQPYRIGVLTKGGDLVRVKVTARRLGAFRFSILIPA